MIKTDRRNYIALTTSLGKKMELEVKGTEVILGRMIIPIREIFTWWKIGGFEKQYGKIDNIVHIFS